MMGFDLLGVLCDEIRIDRLSLGLEYCHSCWAITWLGPCPSNTIALGPMTSSQRASAISHLRHSSSGFFTLWHSGSLKKHYPLYAARALCAIAEEVISSWLSW